MVVHGGGKKQVMIFTVCRQMKVKESFDTATHTTTSPAVKNNRTVHQVCK